MVRVWDLSGQFPLGVQRVQAEVVQRAEELAQERGAVVAQGTEWEWAEAKERESALPRGYRLDSEQGLVRDWESVQVAEMELG